MTFARVRKVLSLAAAEARRSTTLASANPFNYFFLAAFLAAQTAFILADNFALAAGLIFPFGLFAGFTATLGPLIFAHRARAAAAILALPTALSFRRFLGAE